MDKKEVILRIKEILKRSSDTHSVYTPFELCEEMIGKLPEINKEMSIMVMFNLEFLWVIREKLGKEGMGNVWFMTPCEMKKKTAVCIGVNENQVVKYEYNIKEIDKEMPKFDVVVGNPPYQGKKTNNGAGSGNALWQEFLELAYNILIENGYLCFIHPIDWRMGKAPRKKKKAQSILLSNQLIYLKVHIPFPGLEHLIVDWYILKKKINKEKTTICFLDGVYEKNITTEPITNLGSPLVDSIKSKVFKTIDNGFDYGTSFWFDPDNGETKTYKYAHGGNYLKNEYKYYDTPHKYQYNPKVLMSNVRMPRPFFDKGEIGIAGHVSYIIVKNEKEGNFFIKIIKSKLMKFLFQIYATDHLRPDGYGARWQNNYPLTRIKLNEIDLKSDNDIYEYFNLSQEEIDYIESQIK